MTRLYRPQQVYDCMILRLCDGDTVRLLVKVGLEVWREISCRLPAIESWEPFGPDRAKATAAAYRANETWANQFGTVEILRASLDRHGRILGNVQVRGDSLAEWLLAGGLAWRVERSHTHANPKPAPMENPCNATTH